MMYAFAVWSEADTLNHCVLVIIIIITNEKIKVLLSRKRCRGTLQDYNKGEISKCQSKLWKNGNVFSWCLNGTREETVRRDGGRLFYARGAAMGKARSPRVDLCTGGTTSVVVVDDHRCFKAMFKINSGGQNEHTFKSKSTF